MGSVEEEKRKGGRISASKKTEPPDTNEVSGWLRFESQIFEIL